MRVPGLQKGGAPWRWERGELGEEKQVLWLRPSVPELTLCSLQSLPWHGIWNRAQSAMREPAGQAERTGREWLTCSGYCCCRCCLQAPGARMPYEECKGGLGWLTHPAVPALNTAEDAEPKEKQKT